MSFLPYFVLALTAAAVALLTRRWRRVSLAFGIGGLAVATVAALAIEPGQVSFIGDAPIATSQYQRLFLVLGTFVGLVLCGVGLATAWQRNVPAALLASLAWTGLALALPQYATATLATIGAGLAGILVTLVGPPDERGALVGARELRAVTVAGTLALTAVVVTERTFLPGDLDPTILGLAYLAMVVAVALRFGVIPFHAWAGRLSQSAPETALPLLLAWAPAGFAVVALAWTGSEVAATANAGADGLTLERAIVVAIGAASLLLGTFAAWIQDDVEHVVGYSIAQDAGLVILAFAAADGASWVPARTWILIFALAKTAFAGFALALHATYGTRRIDDLAGWARRSPALASAFVLIVLATIGWPGSTAWAARTDLITLATDGPLDAFLLIGAFASLLYYGRLLAVGLQVPGPSARDRAALRIRWPRSMLAIADEAADNDGANGGDEVSASPGGSASRRTRLSVAGDLGATWRLNRAPIGTGLVLFLALLAAVASAGGLGIPAAAAGGPPEAAPAESAPAASAPAASPTPSPTNGVSQP